MLRIVLRATWLLGKIKSKVSAPLPSLNLLPNGMHICILVCLCLTCVVPIAFFGECLWQPSFQHFSLSLKGGILCNFSKMSAQSVSEAPWQVDMERLGFCNPDAAAFEKNSSTDKMCTHTLGPKCAAFGFPKLCSWLQLASPPGKK